MLQHVLENKTALVQAARAVIVLNAAVADVGAVDYEDDGVAARVIAMPEITKGELAADVPELEVHVVEGNGRDVLADGWHGLEFRLGVVREED